MTTITFDTLKLVDKLKDELVTKTYLDIKLSPIITDLAVLKWMMGVLLAGVLSLFLKAFF